MTSKVILNPYSDRWRAKERIPETEAALKACGIDYDLSLTEYPGHGTEVASQAMRDDYTSIIAAGGDGCYNEVINGIIQVSETDSGDVVLKPFGMLPLGAANDLAVNLGLPKDLLAAAKVIAAKKVRMMDLCQVTFIDDNRRYYFGNNSAIGLEPTVTLIQSRMKRLRGILRYLVAALMAIAQNPTWSGHLEWEGGEYHGPITLVSVGNNPLTGGVFYMTPHADPFDGLLTFMYGYLPSSFQILCILPRTMKRGEGSHVEHPAIHEVHSPWLRIHLEQPTPIHTDGEIQSESIQNVEYRILPARLPVFLL